MGRNNRGNQRKGGRGGRGHNNNNNRFKNKNHGKNGKQETKETTTYKDITFHVGKSSHPWNVCTYAIYTHVETLKKGAAVAQWLKEGDDPNFVDWIDEPLVAPENASEAVKKIVADTNDAAGKALRTDIQEYKDQRQRVYPIIWARCDETLKERIESRSDYEEIRKSAHHLLSTIKRYVLNYTEDKYDYEVIRKAAMSLFNLKQGEKESVVSYSNRFKQARESFELHFGGKHVPPSMAKQKDGQSAIAAKKEAYEAMFANMYIAGADKSRYGSLQDELPKQLQLGNDQYPKTISDAIDIIRVRKPDNPTPKKNKKNGNDKKDDEEKDEDNKSESDKKEEDENFQLSFAQVKEFEGKCYCCGSADHKSNECPQRTKPKKGMGH